MKINIITLFLLVAMVYPAMGNMILSKGDERLKIFYTMNDVEGWNAVLKGRVVSFSAQDEYDKQDLFERARDKSKVTVRLYNTEGIREGEILYIINGKNLIVSKLRISVIFKSTSFGYMLIGYGNFRLSSVDDRVVQRVIDNYSQYAYINRARGDYFKNVGDMGTAISEYKKAIELDRGNPEAHLELGMLYKEQGNYQFAFKEFTEAYRSIGRMYDNEDKFLLLKNMAEVRFFEVYETHIPSQFKDKYRSEGIQYCREALKLYPRSVKMNLYLGIFHYKTPKPDDRKARDYFLRVIEIDPTHARAYEYLSELYYKHDNIDKARTYAQRALAADPGSQRARSLIKIIDNYVKNPIIR